MIWTRFCLANFIFGFVAGSALAQEASETPPNQVTITGEVKYIRVDPEITYIQLLTTDQQGNVIEWELERPTIDRTPYAASKPPDRALITVHDSISVVVAPSSALEPKGEIVSATKIEPTIPVE